MTRVTRLFSIDGARRAEGPTVVVDTFRAFSTAAYLLDAGVATLLITDGVDEARMLAEETGGLLCGEERGVRPPDFDLGNSPGEVVERGDLAGATVVQRTSAGTRCVRAAIAAGAEPVYAASLVVAAATARRVGGESLSIVTGGTGGPAGTVVVADEDEVTADYLEALLGGSTEPPDVARIRSGEPGHRIRTGGWAHADDLELALAVDRFPFAMRAVPTDARVALVREE